MIRKALLVPVLFIALAIVGCKGDVGPTGPAGPQGPTGPIGPTGASVAYQVFEGAIDATTMGTTDVDTGGVFPGVVCYFSNTPGVWLQLTTDTFAGTSCGVVQTGSTTYFGSAEVPVSFVDSGWTIRIILFWLP